MIRWVGTERQPNDPKEVNVQARFFFSLICRMWALLTRAPRRRPSGCPGARGTATGSSSHPPGSPPATCGPPPKGQRSVHLRCSERPDAKRDRGSDLVVARQHSGGVDGDCGFGENVVSG